MNPSFQVWGWPHDLILAAIPFTAAVLVMIARARPSWAKSIRLALGMAIVFNQLIWYGYCVRQGWVHFPVGLPLELCDMTLWLTVASLLTLQPDIYDLAYYGALAGSTMALLTPDLLPPLPAYRTIQFFTDHGSVVVAVLFLAWGKLARPRPGSLWRAFGWLNGYAAVLGLFNGLYKTNYMYQCHKPLTASLLDVFGPWPWYLLWSDLLALVLFTLLWLPFRKDTTRPDLTTASLPLRSREP